MSQPPARSRDLPVGRPGRFGRGRDPLGPDCRPPRHLGGHRRADHRLDLLLAVRADIRPHHPEDRRFPLLLLLPAGVHARGLDRAPDRHRAAEEAAAAGRSQPGRSRSGRERGDQVSHVNATTFTIVVVLFLVVTGVGFAAARWRRAEDMLHLNEWGLGGRGFGGFVTWFLLGGDLYTAYTFIAVPALVFGSGAIGFYAVSYTIMVFPIVIIFLPRLWSVCRVHNYITPADFIRGRYGSRGLALSAAFTGILALMPYIALQLVGIQAVLTVMGVRPSSTNTFLKDLPLFVAFLVLAIFTYVSGLRAPALIAFVKDTLIYLLVIVAVFYIPTRLGGWGHIFDGAQAHFASISPVTKKPLGTFVPVAKSIGSTRLDFAS